MTRFAKNLWAAGIGGLTLSLLATSVPAGPPIVLPASLPLYFEAAGGPVAGPELFLARGHDYQFLISAAEAQIALRQRDGEAATVRMQFRDANAQARVRGDAVLPGKVNYFTGSDPAQWRAGVATYGRVRVEELYSGVNLVYYGNQQLLEYDFDIAPGTDPAVIAIQFDGTDKITVNSRGELILSLPGGEIRQPRPLIYQMIGGVRKEIAGGYRLMDAHTVGFAVGAYDHSRPLIIDPVLGFSTYFGGTAGEAAWAVALDQNGNIYITGETFSPKLFTNKWTLGPAFGSYSPYYHGGRYAGDAFVAKLSNSGKTLYYLTYLGGNSNDRAAAIAVDTAGNAYVTGYTDSTNFPTTTNALRRSINGTFNRTLGAYLTDAFVTELDASGSNLVYSTFLGGSAGDGGNGIAVDALGDAYVTGFTYSTNFPTRNAFQARLVCTNSIYMNANGFITVIGAGGSSLMYSTYFGGTNFDQGQSIAVDPNGFVYVAGYTASTNFPTTNAFQKFLNGAAPRSASYNVSDAFVAKFDFTSETNLALVYSSYLGGTNNDVATSIACNANGDAYVTGWTISTNFPNTVTNIAELHSFLVTNTSHSFLATNVFLARITNAIGTTNVGVAWSSVFGGKGVDVGYSVALDPANGNVYVAGAASSTNFPVYNVPGLMSATNSSNTKNKKMGKNDAFVIAFTNDASRLLYSGYLGGNDNDLGYGIAVDASGNAFVVGQTLSTNFPSYNGTVTARNGSNDTFLTKIVLNVPAPTITAQPQSQTNGVGSTVAFFIDGSAYPPFFLQWQKDGTNLVNGTNTLNRKTVISGATNDTLTLSNIQTNDIGNYSIIIRTFGGDLTSSNAFLWVTNVWPTITVQPPTNQVVGAGTKATFSVTASGTPTLYYQWQKQDPNSPGGWTNLVNGGRISGATSNLLTISGVQTNNDGIYTVVVTNLTGIAVTSSPAILEVATAPVIIDQPAGQTNVAASTVTFNVTAAGTIPLRYQWWRDGVKLVNGTNVFNGVKIVTAGATTNALIISNVQITNIGTYSVVISNTVGSTNSSGAYLLVTNIPVTIPGQPTSQTVGAKSTATFTVIASGTAPLSYQWQREDTNTPGVWTNLVNGVRFSGVTNNLLTISNTQTNDAGNYSVVVSNIAGITVRSSPAILKVVAAPEIIDEPVGQTNAAESTVTLAVNATGSGLLSYQWWRDATKLVNGTNQFNGVKIITSGARTNQLIISNVQMTNSGAYTVVISNSFGSVTSLIANLLVTNIPVTITNQPQPTNQVVSTGSNVTYTVAATGTAPLRYQWQKEDTNSPSGWTNLINSGTGGPISGATNRTLNIKSVQTNNTGNYAVIVNNLENSVTSSVVTLTVAAAPLITEQPQPTNQTVAAESTVTYAVTAFGTSPLRYQWQFNGTNLVNGGGISGATTRSLTVGNAQKTNSGGYAVVITNSFGSVTSSIASLAVTNVPVTITVQPQPTNLVVSVGSNVSLTVSATGTLPLFYQWQYNGTNLVNSGIGGQFTGATNQTLNIKSAQTNNNGLYWVIVSSVENSVTSAVVNLTVAGAPVITDQPQPTNQTVAAESTVTYAVTAFGASPLSYQWQFNGVSLVNGGGISGATTPSLTVSNAQTANSGDYSVVITNSIGSVTSSIAALTVTNVPVVITVQPQPTNLVVAMGSNATLTVTATGTAPLYYQWQFNETNLVNGGNISGATSSTLNINSAQTNDSGFFRVIVTNAVNAVTSSVVNLTVATSPVITDQPTNQLIVAGSNVTFAVTVVGTAPLSYQWQLDGVDLVDGGGIGGATTNVLAINNVQTNRGGNYTVIVTNNFGSVTSSPAALTVVTSPIIIVPPTNQVSAAGHTASFSVTAIGVQPLGYQWWFNGTTQLVDSTNVNGSTNSVLILSNVQSNNIGSYTVVVTNSFGSVTSSPASLTLVRLMVVAWGSDDVGQTNVPVAATNVVAIASGPLQCLALRTNGTVVGWGDDTYGQTDVPADLTNAVAIDGGGYHSLALRANGTVAAWGNDSYGQTDVPTDLTNAVAISAGGFHNLALRPDGTVVAWGLTDYSQTNFTATLTNVTAISAGDFHSLALLANSTVVAWGADTYGQTNVPPGLTNVVAISAGGSHSLALLANGTVVAWGAGQVFNPTNNADYGQAIVPAGLSNVVVIAAAGFHSLAIQTDGTVVAWGIDYAYAIGTNTFYAFSQTNLPPDLTNVVAVAGGARHSLALENDGSPYIVRQPVSRTVSTNSTVTFTVAMLGAPTLSYRWQKDGSDLADGGIVSDSTTATLTLTGVQTTDSGGYTVIVSNAIGWVTSSNAVLTVLDVLPAIARQPVDGNTVQPPMITSIRVLSGGNIAIAGSDGGRNPAVANSSGGANPDTYYVLASSNLLEPVSLWTRIATNQFGSDGSFSFTNVAPTNTPQFFYRIQLP
jgi:alpha-tubulin suppressor-like RCC1 family protein